MEVAKFKDKRLEVSKGRGQEGSNAMPSHGRCRRVGDQREPHGEEHGQASTGHFSPGDRPVLAAAVIFLFAVTWHFTG